MDLNEQTPYARPRDPATGRFVSRPAVGFPLRCEATVTTRQAIGREPLVFAHEGVPYFCELRGESDA